MPCSWNGSWRDNCPKKFFASLRYFWASLNFLKRSTQVGDIRLFNLKPISEAYG